MKDRNDYPDHQEVFDEEERYARKAQKETKVYEKQAKGFRGKRKNVFKLAKNALNLIHENNIVLHYLDNIDYKDMVYYYNASDVVNTLRSRGVDVMSNNPSEIALRAFQISGANTGLLLGGAYNLFLWDKKNRKLGINH